MPTLTIPTNLTYALREDRPRHILCHVTTDDDRTEMAAFMTELEKANSDSAHMYSFERFWELNKDHQWFYVNTKTFNSAAGDTAEGCSTYLIEDLSGAPVVNNLYELRALLLENCFLTKLPRRKNPKPRIPKLP